MPTTRKSVVRSRLAVSAALAFLMASIAATPAHADTVRSRQWHLDAMRAEEMWKTSTGRGVTVAVIDSGVDDTVPDLRGQVLDGEDYSDLPGDETSDRADHGTGTAALIAGTGARGETAGSYGLAPGARILPIRMTYGNERSARARQLTGYSHDMATAIRYAADSKAQILNISMGNSNLPGSSNVNTPELAAAVKYAIAKGKLIFAAVGNSGAKGNEAEYPAATPGVVGVGAINSKVERTRESQWGPQVDMVAPGDDMWHACSGGTQLCKTHGTSNSTALASASAALIWSKHPNWTNNQVLRVMINTMQGNEDGWSRDDSVGYGAVRPRIALKSPGDPGPADEYPLPDLAAAAKSPAPRESSSRGPAERSGKTEKSASAVSAEKDGDNSALWLTLGLGAAALLSAALTFSIMRRRRRRITPSPFADPPTLQQPPPTYQPFDPTHRP
ncbi:MULTISPECIES: type VII secretion-associated serine protease mycosin [unclassified Streptomyces]|uniref:type VII secretion-associated serine protease mycosin n=1 Tax=unclassified Streptomyces TaxID=2593676 RepID=UPI00136A1EC5|nr:MULTISPECIES: type VII secretion-associated serine protease mycosin [unclassified Streptomyces]NEA04458.1 type VII secretion-associated serine protease mycosin [Streptomyces sp. SID10116]MYY86318.1 type VII secretion-associated serine protease mycosin [Streptomyces sp. SID335]MYZ13398.1 type VII secretion-associated serine protease mycosin [Streptomyces sp. SID337]NDZ90055.1 type VII secretion-associated serine protease mycosin [Streptomyces sp. SID10115]NEB46411.1 type VII secretion-associ